MDAKELPEENKNPPISDLPKLYKQIEADPFDDNTWLELSERSMNEDAGDVYSSLTLEEIHAMREFATQNQDFTTMFTKFNDRASNGHLWYDLVLGYANKWYHKEFFDILNSVYDRPLFSVGVDVGCGTGDTLIDLSKICQTPIGVDRSLPYLQVARARDEYRVPVQLINGDATNLSFLGPETVDVVTSFGLNVYLTDEEYMHHISELERVIASGGHYITVISIKNSPDDITGGDEIFLTSSKAVMISGIAELLAQKQPHERKVKDEISMLRTFGFNLDFFENDAKTAVVLDFTKK